MRTLAMSTVFVALLLVAAVAVSIPVTGQTIPPMPPVSTPGGPTPVSVCPFPYCAPPIQTPSWVATPTPAVEPGTGDNGATGPGIINTPSPNRPQGLPGATHLHFLPCVMGR